jgi:HAMP domain-containing protein
MSNDDIVNQLLPYVVNEMRMPAGFTITVIEEIERMQAEIERLTKERYGWQATAAGLSQDISNAEDEIERLRAQVERMRAELARWHSYNPPTCSACDTWGNCGYGEPCSCTCHDWPHRETVGEFGT